MPELIKRDALVMTHEEFEAAKGKWPCQRCGRFEHETCNGMGMGEYCPNGRKHPEPVEMTPSLKEACKLGDRFKTDGPQVATGRPLALG